MKKNLLLLACLTLLTYSKVIAQFSLTGEIRPRTEMYGGNNSRLINSGEDVGFATQQRSRLYFNYQDSTGLKIVFSPQLIHFWGQMPQAYDLLGDGAPGAPESNFSVFEAYAQYAVSDAWTVKVGRQAISYGDQRWFGALGWAASGRAHDAFVNKFKLGDLSADVGIAFNRTKHYQGVDSLAIQNIRAGYKNMQYLWLTYPVGDFKIQGMVTNVQRASTNTSTELDLASRTTFGLLPSYATGDFAINASAYWQTADGLSSSLYAFDLTYKGLGLPVTLGADMVSGDDLTTTDSETWQQPFGTNHKFYGFMDFFYVGETPSFGLNDIYAKAVVKMGGSSKLIIMPHIFTTNQDIANDEGGYLGTELDLVYNLNVSKGFNFKLGYSTLFADSLFEEFKGGSSDEFNHWAWLQLTFKPKFL